MVKIGDAIINEDKVIGINLEVVEGVEKDSYIYEVSWNHGNKVLTQVIYSMLLPRDHPANIKEIKKGFRETMKLIKWNEYC